MSFGAAQNFSDVCIEFEKMYYSLLKTNLLMLETAENFLHDYVQRELFGGAQTDHDKGKNISPIHWFSRLITERIHRINAREA